jgi:hypothetical protein
MIDYCSQISDEDIRYICNVIYINDIRDYFSKNSKSFAKIRPGFRANKIKEAEARRILFSNRKNDFIGSFLNKTIDRWLHQINKVFGIELEKSSKNKAYIKALIDSDFKDNVQLYFKLIESEETSEFIELLSESVALISEERKNIDASKTSNESDEKKKYEKKIKDIKKEHDKEVKKLNKQVSVAEGKLEKANEKLYYTNNLIDEINNQLEKEKKNYSEANEELLKVKKENRKQKEQISAMQIEKQTNEWFRVYNSSDFPCTIKPASYKDLELFEEIFQDNLKGVLGNNYNKYSKFLSCLVKNTIFLGLPIVIKKEFSNNIIRCINSSLFGIQNYSILHYADDITIDNIVKYLETSEGSVICLDNFLGNFNETILLSICSHFKNKIVFLTYAYDRTLRYLSEEFYNYILYMNLCQISDDYSMGKFEFSLETIAIDSKEGYISTHSETIHTKTLKTILQELGFSESVVISKSRYIDDNCSLNAFLIFDIVPYCKNVLKKNPFLYSKKFKNYVDSNRFPSEIKEKFEDWFKYE